VKPPLFAAAIRAVGLTLIFLYLIGSLLILISFVVSQTENSTVFLIGMAWYLF
jgi:hypothetical protein